MGSEMCIRDRLYCTTGQNRKRHHTPLTSERTKKQTWCRGVSVRYELELSIEKRLVLHVEYTYNPLVVSYLVKTNLGTSRLINPCCLVVRFVASVGCCTAYHGYHSRRWLQVICSFSEDQNLTKRLTMVFEKPWSSYCLKASTPRGDHRFPLYDLDLPCKADGFLICDI